MGKKSGTTTEYLKAHSVSVRIASGWHMKFKRARSGSSLWMGKKKSTMMPSLLQEEEEFSVTPKIISVILPEKVPPFTWWRSGSRGLSMAIAQALFMLDAFDLNDGTGELLFKRSALPGCRCYSSHKRHLWMKANGHVR